MKILVSPAKSLNLNAELPTDKFSQPRFLEITAALQAKLATYSEKKIGSLMHISDQLAALNYTRFQEFTLTHTPQNARPAIYTFDGDVYTGIDAYSLPLEKLNVLQEKLRILSGLYGILKPLDLVQAYRLEMGTKIGINKAKNLYEVWRDTLTASLNEELSDTDMLVNLASKEYFKAIDSKKIKVPIVEPIFKDYSKGKLKVISFYAKEARGSMVRFILDKNINDLDGILAFNYKNYHYSEEHTVNEFEPVFVR